MLKPWFDRWYDPDDKRLSADPAAPPPDVIHALTVSPGKLHVDFGTASIDAFWAMVALLRDAGARRVVVSETRSRNPHPTPSTG